VDWDQTPPRDACYEERFDKERSSIEPDLVRFDEGWRYIEALVLHHPRRGIETETDDVWVAPMQLPIDGTRVRISVLYSFTDTEVDFLSIRKNEDEDEGEDELF
jgi:hypothetical protein